MGSGPAAFLLVMYCGIENPYIHCVRIANPHEQGGNVLSDLKSDSMEYKHLQCD